MATRHELSSVAHVAAYVRALTDEQIIGLLARLPDDVHLDLLSRAYPTLTVRDGRLVADDEQAEVMAS